MRNLHTLILAVILTTAISCSKEKDDAYSATPATTQSQELGRLTYTAHVAPLMRKTCSAANCHSSSAESAISLTRTYVQQLTAKGTLQERCFNNGTVTSCGVIDNSTIQVLKSWVSQGAVMD